MIAIVRFGENLRDYKYYTNDATLEEGDMVIVSARYKENYNIGKFHTYTTSVTQPSQYVVMKINKEHFNNTELKVIEDKEKL